MSAKWPEPTYVDLDQSAVATICFSLSHAEREETMIRNKLSIVALAALLSLLTIPARAETPPVTEQEAHAIAVDAYIYFYSLVTVDVTRRVATNTEPGKTPGYGPANMFNSIPAFPPADYKPSYV
jgi:hypothetical protein